MERPVMERPMVTPLTEQELMEPVTMEYERAYADDPAPAHASDRAAGDVISLDSMRSSVLPNLVANFEQDDLDVPAFLRKRNEVM